MVGSCGLTYLSRFQICSEANICFTWIQLCAVKAFLNVSVVIKINGIGDKTAIDFEFPIELCHRTAILDLDDII